VAGNLGAPGAAYTVADMDWQKGVQVVVADVEAARRGLIARGVQASDVQVYPWGSFVTFSDPDGNTWALQQLPPWR